MQLCIIATGQLTQIMDTTYSVWIVQLLYVACYVDELQKESQFYGYNYEVVKPDQSRPRFVVCVAIVTVYCKTFETETFVVREENGQLAICWKTFAVVYLATIRPQIHWKTFTVE